MDFAAFGVVQERDFAATRICCGERQGAQHGHFLVGKGGFENAGNVQHVFFALQEVAALDAEIARSAVCDGANKTVVFVSREDHGKIAVGSVDHAVFVVDDQNTVLCRAAELAAKFGREDALLFFHGLPPVVWVRPAGVGPGDGCP